MLYIFEYIIFVLIHLNCPALITLNTCINIVYSNILLFNHWTNWSDWVCIASNDSNQVSFPKKKMCIWQQRSNRTFTPELLIMRIFTTGVWCERKKGLTVLNTFMFWKWKTTRMDRSLTQAAGSQSPGVKKGHSAIMMLLVFAPHISLLQWSWALMCYFVLFLILWSHVMLAVRAVPLRSHQNASWTAVRLQMANAKVPFFYKLPKQKAERTLCHACPLTQAPWSLANSFSLSK